MTTEIDDQKRLMLRWAEGWNRHDADAIVQLFTSDAVYEDVPMAAVSRGHDELRAFATKVLTRFPEITFDVKRQASDGTLGVAEWVMSGAKNGAAGRPVRVETRGVSVFEFSSGRIRRCSDYWDMAAYLARLTAGD